jgi:hypothetical protein
MFSYSFIRCSNRCNSYNVGSGYTYAYIRVADIVAAGATSLTGTELDCIIEPKGGHGFNAVEELGGFFVMTNTNFEGAETSNSGDFTVHQTILDEYVLLRIQTQVVQLQQQLL